MKKFFKIIGIILAVFFGIGIIGAIFSDNDTVESSAGESTEVKKDISKKAEDEPQSEWQYSEDSNEMDDTKTLYAVLESENEVDFEFPYDGGSTFEFMVRKTNGKHEFLLTVSSGQFMTSIMNSEILRIRFDDNEVFDWNFSGAADGSADVIFPKYSKKLLTLLKGSKNMMIEAPFYSAGRKVIKFKTENLQTDF